MSNAALGGVVIAVILGVAGFIIAVFITRAIFRINKIVDLLERIALDMRTVRDRLSREAIQPTDPTQTAK
jgi:hypothetical protein